MRSSQNQYAGCVHQTQKKKIAQELLCNNCPKKLKKLQF